MTTKLRAWIVTIGKRFSVIEESVLFPGHQNRMGKTWARRSGAMDHIDRDHRLAFVEGDCPLPVVSDEMRARYKREGRRRRVISRFRAKNKGVSAHA